MAFFSGAKFRQIPRSHLVAMASSPRDPAHRWSEASSSAIFPGIRLVAVMDHMDRRQNRQCPNEQLLYI